MNTISYIELSLLFSPNNSMHCPFLCNQLDLKGTAEDANDKHLPPWAEICQSVGITNTPLSPYA